MKIVILIIIIIVIGPSQPYYLFLAVGWIYAFPEMVGLVVFYGISTIVGYLMPNPLYTYILYIHDLVGLGFMAYQPL